MDKFPQDRIPKHLPPGGVSTTDGDGGHVPIAIEPVAPAPVPARRRTGRKHELGGDPLLHPEDFKLVHSSPATPGGTTRVASDVREGAMPRTQRPRRHVTSFESIDGQTYTFRTHDTKGKPLAQRITQCLFLALIESHKGGDPMNVLKAFGLNIRDTDGRQIYPIPAEGWAHLRGSMAEESVEEEYDPGEFSLGDS